MTLARLMNLKGRRALITGAAGHLGKTIAATLAELEADLVLVDLPGADFRGVSDAISAVGSARFRVRKTDLESQAEREALIEEVRQEPGGLDILVNNAAFVGTSALDGWTGDFQQQTTECWRRALEVNLTAVFDLCRGFAPQLAKSGRGSIVNVASIYGSLGPDYGLYEGTAMGNPAAYSASKGGLLQLTRWLATTLAPAIRVNCISPGGVLRGQPEGFIRRYEQRTPLRRMAVEDDMRGAVAFLATDMSGYCTGHDLVVDGGWSAW